MFGMVTALIVEERSIRIGDCADRRHGKQAGRPPGGFHGMSSYQFPGGPAVSSGRWPGSRGRMGDRRAFFGARRGLAWRCRCSARLGCKRRPRTRRTSKARDGGTPESGYVGSDPQSPSTGDESPVPTEVQPFTLRPVLAPVEAGPKEITVVAKDVALHRQGRAVCGLDLRWHGSRTGIAGGGRGRDQFHPPNRSQRLHRSLAGLSLGPDATGCELQDDPAGRGVLLELRTQYPGAFMYHCGTPPVLMHIGTGMYGAMIVDPRMAGPARSWSSSRATST